LIFWLGALCGLSELLFGRSALPFPHTPVVAAEQQQIVVPG
jgi:hypothetical protein